MSTAVEERTDTRHAPPEDKDHLLHVFCSPCLRKAKSRAKSPKPYCGKIMPNRPLRGGDDNGKLPICVVCYELATSKPCDTCGTRAIL